MLCALGTSGLVVTPFSARTPMPKVWLNRVLGQVSVIEVHADEYRWAIRRKPTETEAREDFVLTAVVELASTPV